jgi:hypothetical protein
LCNGNVPLNCLFLRTDGQLSNWKSSKLDLSVPLGSQNNKFCSFFSTAVQLITPVTRRPQQYLLQYLPRWERIVNSQPSDTTNTYVQSGAEPTDTFHILRSAVEIFLVIYVKREPKQNVAKVIFPVLSKCL